MSLRDKVQLWLGITDLENNLRQHIARELNQTDDLVRRMHRSNDALFLGLGRVIAKLDPYYGMAEDDPRRKAESDKLGDDVRKRLIGEAQMQGRNR